MSFTYSFQVATNSPKSPLPLLWKFLNLNKYVLDVLIAGIFFWKVTISIDYGLRLKMHALPTLYQDFQSNITPSRASGLFFIVS